MFLKDLTKTVFRGERYIDGLNPSDQEKLLEITEKNEGSKEMDTSNWFNSIMKASVPSGLVGDWAKNKDMLNKGLLKIMERLSYQEFIFLFDRVGTLEQSDEVTKLQTETTQENQALKDQIVKLELEMNEKIEEHETEMKDQIEVQTVMVEQMKEDHQLAIEELNMKIEKQNTKNDEQNMKIEEQNLKNELIQKQI